MKRMLKALLTVLTLGMSLASPAQARDRLTLEDGKFVHLRGEVTQASVAKLTAKILSSPAKEMVLFISSPGGSIFDGLQLIQAMKDSGKKFTCVAATAASMAFVILESCDVRLVTGKGILMQHVAAYSVEGPAPNNLTMVNFINDMVDKMEQDQAVRIGLTIDDFRKKTRNDWWLLGDDGVKNHVVDDVVEVTCTPDLARKTVKTTESSMFFSFDVLWSACPVVEGPLDVKASGQKWIVTNESKQDYESLMKRIYYRNSLEVKIK